jgi:hypothetical protein
MEDSVYQNEENTSPATEASTGEDAMRKNRDREELPVASTGRVDNTSLAEETKRKNWSCTGGNMVSLKS